MQHRHLPPAAALQHTEYQEMSVCAYFTVRIIFVVFWLPFPATLLRA